MEKTTDVANIYDNVYAELFFFCRHRCCGFVGILFNIILNENQNFLQKVASHFSAHLCSPKTIFIWLLCLVVWQSRCVNLSTFYTYNTKIMKKKSQRNERKEDGKMGKREWKGGLESLPEEKEKISMKVVESDSYFSHATHTILTSTAS